MSSVPTTTRAEKALCRTSGGCRSRGRPARPGQSTTAVPSTRTNPPRRWTPAPRRRRSPPRNRARHRSGPRTQTPRPTPTGATGKHETGRRVLPDGAWTRPITSSQSETGRTCALLASRTNAARFPSVTPAGNDVCLSAVLKMEEGKKRFKNKHLYLNKLTRISQPWLD